MPTNNFLQWNPGKVNQESDSAYLADTQRVGGAPTGNVFPSLTGNKLFYQLSTFVGAFAQMMYTKGYDMSDANMSTLASVLAALLTTSDIRPNLINVTYNPIVNLNMASALGFQLTLAGNVTFTVTGANVGDTLTLVIVQDATGGRTVTYPSYFDGAVQPNPTANAVSILSFQMDQASRFRLKTAQLDNAGILRAVGIDATPIGQSVPAAANFTNPAPTDNSQKAATTSWVQALLGFSQSLGSAMSFNSATSGYIKLFGIIIQWGNVLMPGSSSSNNPTSFSFATPFPTACLICIPGTFSPTADRITFIQSVSTTGGTISNNGSAANAVYIAIGH